MIPHTAPPFWPETRLVRFAAAIYKNSPDLLDDPKAAAAVRKCRVGLLGLADDTGVIINHGRPGARRRPHALRAALARYGAAMPMTPPHRPQSSVLSPCPPPRKSFNAEDAEKMDWV
jgi:hypothetical protein